MSLRDDLAAVLGPGNDDRIAYDQADAVLAVLAARAMTARTRYSVRVHAINRHAGYGVPVEVIATSKKEAVARAIKIGWNGHPSDAQVTIDRVEDLP